MNYEVLEKGVELMKSKLAEMDKELDRLRTDVKNSNPDKLLLHHRLEFLNKMIRSQKTVLDMMEESVTHNNLTV